MLNPESKRLSQFTAAFFIGRTLRNIPLNVNDLEQIKENAQSLCDQMFREIAQEEIVGNLSSKQLQNLFKLRLLTKRKISSY